jgi:hypothetical protein
MPVSGELDAGWVQVQPGIAGRVDGAHEIGGPAAVAAASLQHLLATEVHLGRCAVIELDEVPVGLIGLLKRDTQRRVFLVSIVEEQPVITAEQTGLRGEPGGGE